LHLVLVPLVTVAADAVFRLRTAGVITVSIEDYLSAMIAARLLGPGDVIIVVSSTGRTSSTLPSLMQHPRQEHRLLQ
jgi:DNA-binding MurR/RpiR family transcriptional regulator